MDYVTRVKLTGEIEEFLDNASAEKRELSRIKDCFFKPKNKDLREFNPNKVIVRQRAFDDKETLIKINVIDGKQGYTDKKEQVESLEGFEKWGEFESSATEYILEIGGERVKALKENFPFGRFVKIEASSEDILQKAVNYLKIDEEDLIKKNSAALLAEHLELC
jgi:hypothetical protein